MFFCYFKLNLIGLSENKKYAPVIKSSNQKFLSTFNRNRNISNWGLWWQEVWLARYMQLVGHVFVQQNDEGVFRFGRSRSARLDVACPGSVWNKIIKKIKIYFIVVCNSFA